MNTVFLGQTVRKPNFQTGFLSDASILETRALIEIKSPMPFLTEYVRKHRSLRLLLDLKYSVVREGNKANHCHNIQRGEIMKKTKYTPADYGTYAGEYMEKVYSDAERWQKTRSINDRIQLKTDLMPLRTAIKILAIDGVITTHERDEMLDHFMGLIA